MKLLIFITFLACSTLSEKSQNSRKSETEIIRLLNDKTGVIESCFKQYGTNFKQKRLKLVTYISFDKKGLITNFRTEKNYSFNLSHCIFTVIDSTNYPTQNEHYSLKKSFTLSLE